MKNRKIVFVALAVLLALGVSFALYGRRARSTGVSGNAVSHRVATAADPSAATRRDAASAGGGLVQTNAVAALSSRGTKTVRVTADRTVTAELRRALADMGARVIAPVGARAVLVEATPEACRKIAADSRFATEDVLPAAKVQTALAERCAAQPNGVVKVSVLGLASTDCETLKTFVSSKGGRVIHSPLGPDALAAEIPTSLVASLAERGDVRWIEPAPEHKVFNDKTVVRAGANVDSLRTRHMLKGRGQKVTICDTGLDRGSRTDLHLDFSGRVKEIVHVGVEQAAEVGLTASLADYNGHGTHVAGTVLGDGARSEGRYKGMAPAAELYFQATSDTVGYGVWIDSYESLLSKSVANGAYIHSDSWGSAYDRSTYDAADATFDEYLWKHPELLVVVSAGNAGDEGTGARTISAWPACAKNVLTVGNTMSSRPTSSWFLPGDPENLNKTSSRGPTADGRIKPEVAAPGTAVYSTLSTKSSSCKAIYGNAYYTEMTGTSMATPLVSGTAALIREWLSDRRGMTNNPTAALMKAILSGGGVVMTGDGAHLVDGEWTKFNLPQTLPNTDYGWGRVNLEETLYPTNGRAVAFVDRVPFTNGVDWTYDVTTTNAAPLDVQLCWIDYPADASTDWGRTLINDLDLIVSNKTTGAVWRGNGVEGGDHTNTTESVRIAAEDAPAGDYAVIVRGTAVAYDSSEGGAAAIYVRGAFADETAGDPLYVRNLRTGANYEFLDDALAEVAAGDTLQVCRPVELRKSVTLPAGCTIVSTNADPAATLVTRANGAALTLTNGVSLVLTNLAFSASDATLVSVQAGGNVTLCTNVTLGIDIGHVAIRTADAAGFTLAGPLAASLLFHCDEATAEPKAFGSYACEASVAAAEAVKIVCSDDSDRETRGSAEGGQLVWKVTSVPLGEAAGYFVGQDGKTNAYARVDRVFERYQSRTAAGETIGEIVLRETPDPAMRRLSSRVTVFGTLKLRGESAAAEIALAAAEAGFVVPAGTKLVLTDFVTSGAGVTLADCAFKVTGGALTLENGAVLSEIADKNAGKENVTYGGTIVVTSGSVTMKSGSRIERCSTLVNGGGAAIWIGGAKSTANLLGGTITGCSAPNGGGVYSTLKATVNLGGDFTATDNVKADGSGPSNLYLSNNSVFTLTDELTGPVGVSFVQGGKPDHNATNVSFIAVSAGLSALAKTNSAACFSNDCHADFVGACVDDAIVWTVRPPDDGQCQPGEAQVVVWSPAEATLRYYPTLDVAFKYASALSAAELEFHVREDQTLSQDAAIAKCVTLMTATNAVASPVTVWRTVTNETDNIGARYLVKPSGSLTLTNITLAGAVKKVGLSYEHKGDNGLVDVDGGTLTLKAGSSVGAVAGQAARSSNAISVYNSGTLTMESGATVKDSCNQFADPNSPIAGCGGGILLDRSTAYFRGGCVINSAATSGGGVFVANDSTAYVSGDFTVTNNTELSGLTNDNVVVSRNSTLVLADEFTGSIGLHEGIAGETNAFATVTWVWPSVAALTNSAARFFHDRTGACGTAVTNADGTAVLVWSDWLQRACRYVDANGAVYHVCLAPGQSLSVPTAFSVTPTTGANGRMALALEGGVEGCWYTVYSTDDLTKPFAVETSVQLKAGETFEYEVDQSSSSKFYKVVAEEGLK